MMERELIEKICEDWFREISSEIPSELRDKFKEVIRRNVYALLSGEDPERVVKQIDEKLLEKLIRSGAEPEDCLRRLELLLNKLSEYREFEKVAKNFVKFSLRFLLKVIKIYREIAREKMEAGKRAERALRVLSKVNEAIARIEDEETLLKEVCRIIVEEGGYAYAWVGYAEEDKTVRPIADSGNDDYAWTIKVTWDESEYGQGPTGRAIKTGKVAINRFVERDKLYGPWREEALKRGFKSSIALPLRSKGRVIGTLNIYAKEPDAFDGEELSLLQQLAENLSYAITSLKEKEELERLYKLIVENTGTALIVIENEKIIFANSETERLTGYKREELIGKHFTILLPEDDRDKILEYHRMRIRDPIYLPNRYEIRYIDKRE